LPVKFDVEFGDGDHSAAAFDDLLDVDDDFDVADVTDNAAVKSDAETEQKKSKR
jgi:hypothetical protein